MKEPKSDTVLMSHLELSTLTYKEYDQIRKIKGKLFSMTPKSYSLMTDLTISFLQDHTELQLVEPFRDLAFLADH